MIAAFHNTKIILFLALLEIFQGLRAAAADPQDELKAAVVLSFLRFTDFPKSGSDDTPITVGVVGRPSFYQVLSRTMDGKSIDRHPIRTVELEAVVDPHCCQVIYLASEKSLDLKQVLLRIQTAHTLSIGETDRFLDSGGAIRLLTVDGHMGFEVNLEAVERLGVVISSKLLRYRETKGKLR